MPRNINDEPWDYGGDRFKRFIGCCVLGIIIFAAVALTVGYWATH